MYTSASSHKTTNLINIHPIKSRNLARAFWILLCSYHPLELAYSRNEIECHGKLKGEPKVESSCKLEVPRLITSSTGTALVPAAILVRLVRAETFRGARESAATALQRTASPFPRRLLRRPQHLKWLCTVTTLMTDSLRASRRAHG